MSLGKLPRDTWLEMSHDTIDEIDRQKTTYEKAKVSAWAILQIIRRLQLLVTDNM